MSGITGDLKKLFNFKYKVRNDSPTDQYNRMFMVKALLAAAFLTGLSWYKDTIKCIIPKTADGAVAGYAPQACWINGLFIYDELRERTNYAGYYGIPNELDANGTFKDGFTCVANPGNDQCEPMTKMFYLQFQWFPFFLAILAFLYYLPYLCFRYVNNDLFSLKDSIKSQSPNLDDISKNYFDRAINPLSRQNFKIVANIVIKIGYLLVNVLVFVFTDGVLNGDFKNYGTSWINWSSLENEDAYNYVDIRKFVKAGERLLPSFALCDVLEVGMDIKHTLINKHRFVCELSQHVLYQYVLMALWFLMVIGMVVSIIGIIMQLVGYVTRSFKFANEENAARRVFETLSIREGEYLSFIRKKNVPIYGELVRKLYHDRIDAYSPSGSSKRSSFHKDTHM